MNEYRNPIVKRIIDRLFYGENNPVKIKTAGFWWTFYWHLKKQKMERIGREFKRERALAKSSKSKKDF